MTCSSAADTKQPTHGAPDALALNRLGRLMLPSPTEGRRGAIVTRRPLSTFAQRAATRRTLLFAAALPPVLAPTMYVVQRLLSLRPLRFMSGRCQKDAQREPRSMAKIGLFPTRLRPIPTDGRAWTLSRLQRRR